MPKVNLDGPKFTLDGNAIFQKIIWLLITGAVMFASKKTNDIDSKFDAMSKEISQLNITITKVISDSSYSQGIIRDHEVRLRALEGKKTHAPLEP